MAFVKQAVEQGRWGACTELNPVYRQLIRLAPDDLQLIEQQIGQLDQVSATI